ncbi:MAG: hypothetical protein JO253_06050 [Alphaproteobacteria bacterium]|nr:hypothetical protein [Alphaproteobacteria bacterium]
MSRFDSIDLVFCFIIAMTTVMVIAAILATCLSEISNGKAKEACFKSAGSNPQAIAECKK